MASLESLNQSIVEQTALVNELRLQGAEAAKQDEAKKKLGELKKAFALAKNAEGGGSKEKKKDRLLLKTPKVSACYSRTAFATC